MDWHTPGFSVLHYLPELAQTHVHWVSDAIPPSRPLLSPVYALNLSQHQGNESALIRRALRIRWPKFWRSSISPSNEYSELISFRIDWCNLLAVQETLKRLLQHRNSKASIHRLSVFMVELAHIYLTTGKITALTLSAKWCICFLMCYPVLSYLSWQGASIFLISRLH